MDEATASIDMATVCEASDHVQNLRPDMTQGLPLTTNDYIQYFFKFRKVDYNLMYKTYEDLYVKYIKLPNSV